jgi:hypothetical protein
MPPRTFPLSTSGLKGDAMESCWMYRSANTRSNVCQGHGLRDHTGAQPRHASAYQDQMHIHYSWAECAECALLSVARAG